MSGTRKTDDEYQNALEEVKALCQNLLEENQRQHEQIRTLANALRDLRGMKGNNAKEPRISSRTKQRIIRGKIDEIFTNKSDLSIQDRLWLQHSNLKTIPDFIPVSERPISNGISTRFISFLNFKGGVGKTTLVANLCAAFAGGLYDLPEREKARPLRVLVVDLDFQGTLTDRCIASESFYTSPPEKLRSSADLLSQPSSTSIKLSQLLYNFVETPNARIIPGVENLENKDSESFMRLACELVDTRFYYRLWFHKPEALSHFDLVIFDCPPRITASSVCALTVSDFVFIPTSPDLFDRRSLTRTLSFIQKFRKGLNLSCKIGGVILNRTSSEKKLSVKEKAVVCEINQISGNDAEYNLPVLQTFIPKRSGDNSIIGNLGDPLPGGLRRRPHPYLNDLASEIYAKIYQ